MRTRRYWISTRALRNLKITTIDYLSSTPRELITKLIISLFFLTSATLIYFDSRAKELPYAEDILSSKLIFHSMKPYKNGSYQPYLVGKKSKCLLPRVNIKVTNFFGETYLIFNEIESYKKIADYILSKKFRLSKAGNIDEFDKCNTSFIRYSNH